MGLGFISGREVVLDDLDGDVGATQFAHSAEIAILRPANDSLLLVIKRKGEETPGTASMIREATSRGMPVHVEEANGLPLPGERG